MSLVSAEALDDGSRDGYAPRAMTAIARVEEGFESLAPGGSTLIAWAGEHGAARTFEFLAAAISNLHTRRAYHRATTRFMCWCVGRELALEHVQSPHVALYLEELGRTLGVPSVKQHLSALRHWFDWLVTGHVLRINPASAVRGPRYVQHVGKTPVLERDQAKALLDSIVGDDVLARRDKALLAVMLFSFARVGAVVRMKVRDYQGAGTSRACFVLHEKGGRHHPVPAHHQAAELVDAYIAVSGLQGVPHAPLWQGARGAAGRLSGSAITERAVLAIVKRRCKAVGLPPNICNHSFRATGITLHQDAGGDLEAARQLAGHASVKTTQLYNRSGDMRRRAEVERVQL